MFFEKKPVPPGATKKSSFKIVDGYTPKGVAVKSLTISNIIYV